MSRKRSNLVFLVAWVACFLCAPPASNAFPPAPHHVFFGMVRDEWGNPLDRQGAEVILATASGVKIKAQVVRGSQAGINYTLKVPMDSGLTADVRQIRAEVPVQEEGSNFKFFRLMLK